MTNKKKPRKKKVIQFDLPKGMEMIGVYKLKDKEGRRAVKLNLKEPIKSVIIQKVVGKTNTVIIAVEKGEIERKTEIIMPKLSVKPRVK